MTITPDNILEVAQSMRDDPTMEYATPAVRRQEAQMQLQRYGTPTPTALDETLACFELMLPTPAPIMNGPLHRPHIPVPSTIPEPVRPGDQADATAVTAQAIRLKPHTLGPELTGDGAATVFAPVKEGPVTGVQADLPQAVAPIDGKPLLWHVKTTTGATDAALANLIGVGRSTVQAIIGGRLNERLDARQRSALQAHMQGAIAPLQRVLDLLA